MARRPLGLPFLLPANSIASTAVIGVAAFAFLIAPHRPPTPAEPPSTPPAEPPAAAEILLAGSHAEWTAEWAGVYRRTNTHNGAPYYSKSGDDSRVVWRQKAAHGGGFWHVGHPADVAQGEAVIAADDGGAASPDLVSSGWRAVEGPGTWRRSSRLRFVAPPPASVYLSGHAPAEAAWLAGWLGEYVLRRDLLVNGWPTFESRRCGATPCDRRLWFAPARPAAAHGVGSAAEQRVLGLVYSLLLML